MEKVKPALLRGFDQEYLPHEQLHFNHLVELIRRNFELYGFLPIETPSAERAEVLTSKGGVENMRVAVMGCVVNGPGESKHADIGISLPGTGEVPVAPVYVDGKKTVTLKGERIAEEFQAIVEDYVRNRYKRRIAIKAV